jgi:hypothetical protein
MTDPLAACCAAEAKRSLKKARDVATCDRCGHLLLGWEDPDEQLKTRVELEAHGVAFSEGKVGKLYVTSKARGG